PSLSIGGNLGTNWSDLAKEPGGFLIARIPQPGVFINGQSALVEVETSIPTTLTPISYGTQLNNNIGYGVGATLSIPIYNQHSVKGAVQKSRLQLEQSKINSRQIDQTLKSNIQN